MFLSYHICYLCAVRPSADEDGIKNTWFWFCSHQVHLLNVPSEITGRDQDDCKYTTQQSQIVWKLFQREFHLRVTFFYNRYTNNYVSILNTQSFYTAANKTSLGYFNCPPSASHSVEQTISCSTHLLWHMQYHNFNKHPVGCVCWKMMNTLLPVLSLPQWFWIVLKAQCSNLSLFAELRRYHCFISCQVWCLVAIQQYKKLFFLRLIVYLGISPLCFCKISQSASLFTQKIIICHLFDWSEAGREMASDINNNKNRITLFSYEDS